MLRSLLQASIRTLLTNSHAKIAEHAQSFCRCVEGTQLNATHAQLLEKLRPIALAEACRFLTIQSLEF